MWLQSHETKLNDLLMENKIIEYEKKGNIKCHIGPTAGSITKSLQRHPPFKGWVKKIYQ